MPNYDAAEERLISEIAAGSTRGVKSALAAGVSVDGSGELAGVPLMTAVVCGHFGITKLLIEKGADLDICIQRNAHHTLAHSGVRVIHFAAGAGRLDILRLLVEAGANLNCADEKGCTPLMEACQVQSAQRVLLAQELLRGGADPAQSNKLGQTALHYTAILGNVDLMDTLLTQAPTTLNRATAYGLTALGAAACWGKDRAVSYLLSAGACESEAIAAAAGKGTREQCCPLVNAVSQDHENVVRILLDDGLEAIGGSSTNHLALGHALRNRRPRILQRLLNVDGEGRQGHWATCCYRDNPMVYIAAAQVDPAGISVLLAAGADETALGSDGRQAKDVVGLGVLYAQRDAVKMAAVRRALERAPAFRAQSWRWPSRGTGTTTAAATDDDDDDDVDDVAPLSSRGPRVPLDVRVFRPRDRKLLGKIVSRYAEKQKGRRGVWGRIGSRIWSAIYEWGLALWAFHWGLLRLALFPGTILPQLEVLR